MMLFVSNDFGEFIRFVREKHRLTQVALAEKIGVSPTTIRAIEDKKDLPSGAVLEKLCKNLGLELEIRLSENMKFIMNGGN